MSKKSLLFCVIAIAILLIAGGMALVYGSLPGGG